MFCHLGIVHYYLGLYLLQEFFVSKLDIDLIGTLHHNLYVTTMHLDEDSAPEKKKFIKATFPIKKSIQSSICPFGGLFWIFQGSWFVAQLQQPIRSSEIFKKVRQKGKSWSGQIFIGNVAFSVVFLNSKSLHSAALHIMDFWLVRI